MVRGKRICFALLIAFMVGLVFPVAAQQGPAQGAAAPARLARILESKVLRVGTPGDYRPFSMLNKATGQVEGHDVDLAKLLAADLGVNVEFVLTTWSRLMDDLLADKYDIAMGGITRSLARMLKVDFLGPYAPNGKVALIRAADKNKFTTLAAVDRPEVTIMVNPGGTNEKFVLANIKNAKVVTYPNNAEIPGKVADGIADVMITEAYEAVVYSKLDSRLYGAFIDKPLTKISYMGFMLRDDDPQYVKVMNFIWNDAKMRGDLDALFEKWLK